MKEENEQEKERFHKTTEATNSESTLEEEITAGEWQRLHRFETYRRRSRQGKIIATHQALANRIRQLEKLFYELARNHPEKSAKLLSEIKRLRYLLEYLLQCLIWEERGELDDHAMPEELEEVL